MGLELNSNKSYIFFLRVYLLALPLGAMSIGAIGSALKLIALIPVFLAFTRLGRVYISLPMKHYFMYILICGISVLYSLNITPAWNKFSSLLLLFLLVTSACCFKYSKSDIAQIKIALIWSSRISCLLCLLFNNFVEGRLYFQNDRFSEDPNYFCAYLAFGAIFAIEKLISGEKLKNKLFAVIEVAIYLTVALLSGSRGGTIALLFGIVIYILFANRNVINMQTVMIVAVLSISLYIGTTFLSEDILSRFTLQSIQDTGGTGRAMIWEKAFIMFEKSNIFRKIFGQGIGNTIAAWSHYGIYEYHVCHNMFIESLVEIGLIGVLTYVSMIFSFFKIAFRKQKYAFGVMGVMFFLSLSTSISTFKPYINTMIYILCLVNCIED